MPEANANGVRTKYRALGWDPLELEAPPVVVVVVVVGPSSARQSPPLRPPGRGLSPGYRHPQVGDRGPYF